MVRAAEAWVSEHAWEGPYQLAAVGLDGKEVEFIENVEL
jgi:hypothetical protein